MTVPETPTKGICELVDAVRFVINKFGVRDQQQGTIVYTDGDLIFRRTNTNDIEVEVNWRLVFSAPSPDSIQKVYWESNGDWMKRVYEISNKR